MAQANKARQEIELTGEAKYKAALKSIENNLKGVAVQQKLLDSEYARGDTSMEKMGRQYELLGDKLQAQRNRLRLIKAELDRVTQAQGADSEAAVKLRNAYAMAQRDINNTERAMSELSAQMAASAKHASTFMERMREMHITLPAIGDKMDQLGGKMTRALSAPIAALGIAAGKSFLEYDKGLATVSTIADTTQVSMEALSKSLLTASSISGMAAEDITGAAYSALSAGVETKNVASFTQAAAKAAKAGLTDVETVVDGATSAINAWSLGYENADQVLDKFIVTQDLGKTTVGDLAQSIGQLTGIAPQVGVSLDSMLAATAALTKNGVQTSTAMNGLKAVMTAVIKPTAEASKAAKKLKLDFSAENLRNKGFTGFLQEVLEKTGGSEEKLATLFGSVEGLSQVMLLAGGAADDYAETLSALGNSAGAVDRAFNKITSSKAEQLALAMNNVKNQGIRLGETFAPAMQSVANGISTAADMMASLNDEQIESLAKWGLMIAALGPLTSGLGKTIKSVSSLVKGYKMLNTLTGGLAGPAALALTAVVALGAGISALKKHMDSLEGVNQIKAAFDNIHIDTSAVQAAVDAASETEYQLQIHVQNKLEFEETGEELAGRLVGWWGRNYPSNKSKQEFKNAVSEWVAPLIAKGKEATDEETQALAVDLENTSAQYSKYALQLAMSSKKPTEEQLAELQLLHDKIVSLGEQIMVATDAAASAAQGAYARTKRGVGTTADAALAVEWAQMQYNEDMIRADLVYDPVKKEAEAAMVAADKAGDTEAFEAAMEVYNDAVESVAEAEQQASEKYTASINELVEGLAQQHPEQMAALREIQAQSQIIEGAMAFVEEGLPEGIRPELYQSMVDDVYKGLTGVDAAGTATADMIEQAVADARAANDEQQRKIDAALAFTEADIPDDMSTAEWQQQLRTVYEDLTGEKSDIYTNLPAIYEAIGAMYDQMEERNEAIKKAGDFLAQDLPVGLSYEDEQALLGDWLDKLNYDEVNGPLDKETVISAIEQAQEKMAASVESTDLAPLMQDFYASVQSGMLDEVDPGAISEDLGALLTAVDLKDDGMTIGQGIVAGEIQGIENEQGAINQAVIDHCKDVIAKAMEGYGEHSPSKEFDTIGYNTMAGEALGINRGGVLPLSALQRHIGSMRVAALGMYSVGTAAGDALIAGINSRAGAAHKALEALLSGSATGGSTSTGGGANGAQGARNASGVGITNNVSVNYSGSVTQRDTQRLAQQLGAYIKG